VEIIIMSNWKLKFYKISVRYTTLLNIYFLRHYWIRFFRILDYQYSRIFFTTGVVSWWFRVAFLLSCALDIWLTTGMIKVARVIKNSGVSKPNLIGEKCTLFLSLISSYPVTSDRLMKALDDGSLWAKLLDYPLLRVGFFSIVTCISIWHHD